MFKAVESIILMLLIFLFGSRDVAYEKDFVYLNPVYKIRKLLYLRQIPKKKIALSSIAMQSLIIITLILQIFSIAGVGLMKPLLSMVWFGKYTFMAAGDPYFQTLFCVGCVFFPVSILIVLYTLICALFAPRRFD